MLYEKRWWGLSEAVTRVVKASGFTRQEAQSDICRAIADGAVDFRCKVGKHIFGLWSGPPMAGRENFELPANISPEDFDWDSSRPKKPWAVPHNRFGPRGYWYLDRIELFGPDVIKVLGLAHKQPDPAQQPLSNPLPVTAGARDEGLSENPSSRSGASRRQELSQAAQKRTRGRRPKKLEQTVDAMRDDIRGGRLSAAELENLLEKELVDRYGGVSRDTARRARKAVLSELKH
jgi:hypothetical protein